MGRRRKSGRQINGILLLDKPNGASSNAALQAVKRLFKARKAGHTGSLDPLASGLLPICFGRATKISGFLLDADKRYWVRAKLGIGTDTGDAEGEVSAESSAAHVKEETLLKVLQDFTGVQQQVPPMYSAVKHKGKRLYELAREGIEVEREPREITLHELRLLKFQGDCLELDMHCSKGTYVRTLIEDIAAALDTCAHVIELRRTAVGPFDGETMYDMPSLERLAEEGTEALDVVLLPTDSALARWPDVRLDKDSAFYIGQGQPVLVPQAPTQGWVCIYGPQERFMGVGEVLTDGRVAPRRMLG